MNASGNEDQRRKIQKEPDPKNGKMESDILCRPALNEPSSPLILKDMDHAFLDHLLPDINLAQDGRKSTDRTCYVVSCHSMSYIAVCFAGCEWKGEGLYGRGGGIRTHDLCVPNAAR